MSEQIRAWVLNPSAPNDVVIEEAETGRHVLKDYGVYEGMSIDDSDQGVAVACVTHCAGFTTEQVEAVSMREMAEALRELAESFEGRMGDWENAELHDSYNRARSILKKLEGGNAYEDLQNRSVRLRNHD